MHHNPYLRPGEHRRFARIAQTGSTLMTEGADGGNMKLPSNTKLTSNARKLRKTMTKEERHLWYDFLRDLPIMVHRQKVIGSYIVDFYIDKAQLAIELDGSQHYEPDGRTKDAQRDVYLQSLGITVLRYSNADVNTRFESVCQDIWNRLPLESPLLGEGGMAKP